MITDRLLICIFNITTLSSYMSAVILPTINITGRESYEVQSFRYKNISLINNQHIKSNVVTLNCIFLTYNVPVVTPSVVVFEM